MTLIFKFDPRKGQLQVKLGQISKFKIFLQNMPILCRFVSGFQKCHLFLCTTIRNEKNTFKKCDVITFTCFFLTLHRQKQRHCFEILHACLYVSRSHVFRFFEIFPRFWKYIKKSKFLVEKYQDLEIYWFWKFRDSSFLCQAFLCLWPDFGVSRLLIWLSAIFPINKFSAKNGRTWP